MRDDAAGKQLNGIGFKNYKLGLSSSSWKRRFKLYKRTKEVGKMYFTI